MPGPLLPAPITRDGAKAQTAESQPRPQQQDGRNGVAATQTALNRLADLLASGKPPRQDVPRGSYLNISV
ncbi:hypothetical protein [Defluviicoccus vanus]|uniref:Uncharacterized protein n=1 Tax=Defluviicoccus vanus TaxID=111831 RepID=A0A7H1MXM0_9PROT|nr:hypothetical protein [Defluviicoccus vanus]QNT68206.1 hypothetical protein HQ394_01020 [Defluviicoccus vanus]